MKKLCLILGILFFACQNVSAHFAFGSFFRADEIEKQVEYLSDELAQAFDRMNQKEQKRKMEGDIAMRHAYKVLLETISKEQECESTYQSLSTQMKALYSAWEMVKSNDEDLARKMQKMITERTYRIGCSQEELTLAEIVEKINESNTEKIEGEVERFYQIPSEV